VGALLERGQARASADGLAVQFKEADAENLPFADGAFDAVLSTFGVMFTPNQERAAGELVRVCKSGGMIGLANWTPTGFIGELFKLIGRYLPPPAGVKPPSLWGTEDRLRELFGKHAATLETSRKHFVFRYRSPQHWLDTFRTYYGPMQKTFGTLDAAQQSSLADDLLRLAQQFNNTNDGTLVAPSEYLEVAIRLR
jgi:ubiquinone/menaquinone biosynthesis C-methylase UbiE